MQVYNSHSESETENIAYGIASQIKRGDIIALFGDLGAGKTAFTRGLARFFLPDSRVSSPTFALFNQYKYIFHFDMYRITSEEDLLSIGFFDYLDKNNIIIIEWFDKIQEFFDEQTVEIEIIKCSGDDTQNLRKINFKRI
jgi:tRNA threonylcarbamoyladenosine biosynthesis protein TsaE